MDVGQRVLPHAVEAGDADPPQRVLDLVARRLGVVLVQVGQDVDEPALERRLLRLGSRVRVLERPGLPGVREVLLLRAVVPRRRRRVRHPRVVRPAVVRDLVLDHPDARGVGPVDHLAQRREIAEVLLDAVEVDGPVAVVVGDRLPVVGLAVVQVVDVVVPGVEPQRGDAELLQVRQLLDDPAQVAAVVVPRLRAVEEALRAGGVVVRRIAVREAVGHDQVDDVVRREALEAALSREGSEELERHRRRPAGGLQRDRARAGRGARVDRDVDERVRAALVDLHRPRAEARSGRARRGAGEARPADEQPHGVDRVPGPPARRLDLRDGGRRGGGDRRGEEKREGRRRAAHR